jgi:hypothetical protein
MPLYPYAIRFTADEPFLPVNTMAHVEATSPMDALDELTRLGRLPTSGPLFYLCLVTETHDNGVPHKVISIPICPE